MWYWYAGVCVGLSFWFLGGDLAGFVGCLWDCGWWAMLDRA